MSSLRRNTPDPTKLLGSKRFYVEKKFSKKIEKARKIGPIKNNKKYIELTVALSLLHVVRGVQ